MHRIHAGLTVIVPLREGHREELSNLLKRINVGGKPDFDRSNTTLFAAGVIIPKETYKSNGKEATLPESLVFATTYYGLLLKHLKDLWTTNHDNLCEMFCLCKEFPCPPTEEQFIAFMKKKNQTGTFNSRFNLITKEEVKDEKELRSHIENYIEKAQSLGAFENITARQAKTLICRHLKSLDDEYEWAFKPFKRNFREWLQTAWVSFIPISFILLLPLIITSKHILLGLLIALSGLAGLLILLLFLIFRQKNKSANRPSDAKVRALAATQLNPVTNGMTACAPLKRGWARRHFYFFALKAIGLVSHIIVTVPTVSSIRWLSVDKRKRLLFLSNYSNTTDFYVRDFLIGDTPKGVNFMFTNGTGFPDARFGFKGGISTQPEKYMNAVHTGQQVMDLWYTHENELTIDMINRNRAIRNGLIKEMNEQEAKEWLRLL